MGLWLKSEVAAATAIIKRATETNIIASTGTTVIGIIMATGKKIVRMVIEIVYNPSIQFTPPSLC